MANEITALEGSGGIEQQVLFFFPISTPEQVAGANVVPTPASTLPATADAVMSAAQKTSLDNGTAAFEIQTIQATDSKTNQQLATEARDLYAKRQAEFADEYNRRYRFAGIQIDAVV